MLAHASYVEHKCDVNKRIRYLTADHCCREDRQEADLPFGPR